MATPSSQGNYVDPDKRPWIWWTKLWCQSNLKLQPGCRFHVTAGQGPNTLFLLQTWTKTPSALFQEANIAWMSRRKTFHFRLPPTLKTTRALTQRGKRQKKVIMYTCTQLGLGGYLKTYLKPATPPMMTSNTKSTAKANWRCSNPSQWTSKISCTRMTTGNFFSLPKK